MHLHGLTMEVFQRDGYPVVPPYVCDTIDVPPGNRFDCIIDCAEAGLWAFHCHVLSHAENSSGFFGLVTVMAVEDETFKVADLLNRVEALDIPDPRLRVGAAGANAGQDIKASAKSKGAFAVWCDTQA